MKQLLQLGSWTFLAFTLGINLLPINVAFAQQKPVTPLSTLPNIWSNCRLGDGCARSKDTPHTGVDYPASKGSKVRAICDGTIKYLKNSNTDIWSRFVVIEHSNCGGYTTLYAYYGHINSGSGLREGSKVVGGQEIGTVADWGKNSHLHFGLATKLFSSGWGYQSKKGNPENNGWINPESFRY
jgi:murein DD-endopeptidase MepM/ murein hydrolase activator NlpD